MIELRISFTPDSLSAILQAMNNPAPGSLWSRLGWATPGDLEQLKDQIMSAISDFKAKQDAFNDKIDAAVDGLTGDVQGLKNLIVQLQGTQGQITPEDQGLLDQIQARTEAIANKLSALDELTPPAPPAA